MTGSVLAVLCVRQTSERLPAKCLEPIGNVPSLERIIIRLRKSKVIGNVVAAVPDGRSQEELRRLMASLGVPVTGGSEHDVAARMDAAVQRYAAPGDYVFRAMADQPFFDWELFTSVALIVMQHHWDFMLPLSFTVDPVYGCGNSPWSLRAWQVIAQQSRADEREHPGMVLRRDPARFSYGLVDLPHWTYRAHRLELDTSEDLQMMRMIEAAWGKAEPQPTRTAVQFLDSHPAISSLNSWVPEKTGTYTSYSQSEISTWQKDFEGREVIWPQLGSRGTVLGRDASMGRGMPYRCRNFGSVLEAVETNGRNDLVLHCSSCGAERIFYSIKKRK